MLDTILDWLVVLLPTLVSVAGVLVSIKAPQSHHHKAWYAGLIVFGLLMSGLLLWQQMRSRSSHASELKQLNDRLTEIQHNTQTPPQFNVPPAQVVVIPPSIANSTLRGRGHQIKPLIFKSSAIFTEARKMRITDAIEEYYHYLVGIGFDPTQQLPPIGLGATYASMHPSNPVYGGYLAISEKDVDDNNAIRQLCGDYAFSVMLDVNAGDESAHRKFAYRWWMANVLSEYFSSSFSDVGRFNNLGYNGWLPILWQIRTSCGKDLTNRALLYATKSREPDVPLSDPKMQAFDDYFRRRLSEGESVVDDTSFSGLACINQIINSRKVNH